MCQIGGVGNWGILSNEWWVMSDEWRVTIFFKPNKALVIIQFSLFLFFLSSTFISYTS